MSARLKEILSVPVFINEKDREGLDFPPDNVFSDGGRLFCGIRVINFHGQKTPGESAFYIEDRKIMIVGDALIGRVPGKVNLLPEDKYPDPARVNDGLRVLLDYPFETLLVGDGTPILTGPREVVADFLTSTP